MPARPEDSAHVTAIYGDWVALNCDVNFPDGHVVPYVVQWWRKVGYKPFSNGLYISYNNFRISMFSYVFYKLQERDLPIYIWYDNYPSHIAKEYVNRVDRVDSADQRYGLASLNLTKVTEKDRGWYNCKVLFLDRGPDASVVIIFYQLNFNTLVSHNLYLQKISYFIILSLFKFFFYIFTMVHGIILMYTQSPILSKNQTTLYT